MADGTIIALDRDGYRAEIRADGFGFALGWGEASVKEWTEFFTDLPTAIVRLAVVDHIMATGAHGWFRDEADRFNARAAVLLADSVTMP